MRVVITAAICILSGVFGGLAANDFNVASAIGIGLIAICMTLEIVGDRIVEKRVANDCSDMKAKDAVMCAIVVFHCVNSSTGEIYQSEECVIKAGSDHLLLTKINDQKCELANKHHRPIIVHQIVKL